MAKQITVNKFYLGNTLISDLKFGGVDVDRVYKQGEIVFDRGEVPEGTDFMFYMTFDGDKPIQGGWYFNGEAVDITDNNHNASGDYSAWKVSSSSPTQIHATSGYIEKYGMYGREFDVGEDPTDEYYTGKLSYIFTWRPSDDSQDYEVVTIASGTIDNYIASDRYEFNLDEEYRYTYGVYRLTVSVEDSDTGGNTPDPEPEPEQYKAGTCINNTIGTLQLYWQETGGSENYQDWEPGEMDFYLDNGKYLTDLAQFGLTYQIYPDGSEQDDNYYHGDLYYKLYGIDSSSGEETVVWSGFQEDYNFKISILTGMYNFNYDLFKFVCSSTEIEDPNDKDPDDEPEPDPD